MELAMRWASRVVGLTGSLIAFEMLRFSLQPDGLSPAGVWQHRLLNAACCMLQVIDRRVRCIIEPNKWCLDAFSMPSGCRQYTICTFVISSWDSLYEFGMIILIRQALLYYPTKSICFETCLAIQWIYRLRLSGLVSYSMSLTFWYFTLIPINFSLPTCVGELDWALNLVFGGPSFDTNILMPWMDHPSFSRSIRQL